MEAGITSETICKKVKKEIVKLDNKMICERIKLMLGNEA